MYPKNAASPEPIAIGAVIQISDGAVQTSGCTVRIKPIGVAEGDGAGTTAYSTDGVVLYTPTQAETNYTSFVLIAKKTSCVPASITVVTTASSTPGTVEHAGTIKTLDALDTAQDLEHDATQAAISGIGTAGGAAINVDATTDNSAGGISGVTSGTTKVGTETGTFSNTSFVDGSYHLITHATNAIDWVYQFLTGGGTSVVSATWTGYLDGSNDTITFYAWNHVGGAWESIGTQVGQAGTANVTKNFTLYSRHRGTSSAELGKVYFRVACTGQTSPVLRTDALSVSYSVSSRSVGYALGATWIDTTTGIAGTESFVNGVADNPVLTLADALTIATAVGLRKFEVGNGSSITLAATTSNKVFNGHEWTLALGGQNISMSMFIDASVSGTGTGTLAEFETCEIGTTTVGPAFFHGCSFGATLTMGAAGDYFFYDCHSSVAGTSTPVFDLASAGACNLSFRRWSGGITFNNISSNDVISIDVVSGGTITLNGADGNVQVRGMCSSIVDNRTGSPTLGKNAVINQTLIATPTNITGGTITTLSGHTPQTGDSYPKVNELHAATIVAAGIVGATRTTSSFFTNLTQANNYWNDAQIVFTSGNMDGIPVIVSAFFNANGEVITAETMPLTPDAGINFSIVARHTHSTAAIAAAANTAVVDGTVGTGVLAIQQILSGITSMANWIRRIVRQDAGTAGMVTAQSEINTGGTATFDGTTDSLEGNRDRLDVADIKTKSDQLTFTVANKVDATATATIAAADIRSALGMAAADLDDQLDAILAAASASAGSGARTVTITVNDGATAIQNAVVRLADGVTSYRALTNASGVAVFNVDDATYTVSITKIGYTYAGTTIIVNGTETATYSMTATVVTPPTDPTLSAIEVLCLGADFAAEAGIDIDFRIVIIPSGDVNHAYPGLKVTVTSDVDGIARWEAPQSSTIEYKRGTANIWERATLDADGATSVTSVIGSP